MLAERKLYYNGVKWKFQTSYLCGVSASLSKYIFGILASTIKILQPKKYKFLQDK